LYIGRFVNLESDVVRDMLLPIQDFAGVQLGFGLVKVVVVEIYERMAGQFRPGLRSSVGRGPARRNVPSIPDMSS